MPKLRPILFNTEMVKAILDGHKTETRRVIKQVSPDAKKLDTLWPTPPYCIGDYLYVRETYCPLDIDHVINGEKYVYKADCTAESECVRKELGYKWRPSIHMPKEAARLFLKVENVKIRHLRGMQKRDFQNEGLASGAALVGDMEMCEEEFKLLWNSTVSDPRYKWENDPWVWVIQFKVVDRKEVKLWLKENAE